MDHDAISGCLLNWGQKALEEIEQRKELGFAYVR